MKDNIKKKHEILLGLTTTPLSNWRKKVEEIKKFNIKRIALFPTFLELEQRKELYELLDDLDIEAPHVHLRDDMEEWELDMFVEKFGAKAFNIHERGADAPVLKKYKPITYVENHYKPVNEDIINQFAGQCIDFSHMHVGRNFKKKQFDGLENILGKYPIGCCHISGVSNCKLSPLNIFFDSDRHFILNVNNLDYVRNYVQYLPEYVSLELENSFKFQLKAKEFLKKIINNE